MKAASKLDVAMNSDFLKGFMQSQETMAARNIVPGSVRYVQQDCINTTYDTFRSENNNRTFLRLGPISGQATIMQNNDVHYNMTIPAGTFALQVAGAAADNVNPEIAFAPADVNTLFTAAAIGDVSFWIGYDAAGCIANDAGLSIGTSNTKWTANGFFDVQSLLCALGVPDSINKSDPSIANIQYIKELSELGPGSMITIPAATLFGEGSRKYNLPEFTIEGIIDLSKTATLFNYMPIFTDHYRDLYLHLIMDHILKNLKVAYLTNEFLEKKMPIPVIPLGRPGMISRTITAAQAPTLKQYRTAIRIINAQGFDAATHQPIKEIHEATGVRFTQFNIRQIVFDLEDYEVIDSIYRVGGSYSQCVQDLHSTRFLGDTHAISNNTSNAVITDKNIAAMYFTFPFTPGTAPLFWPNPLIKNVSLNIDGVQYPSQMDVYVDKACQRRIANCFVDTDECSPSTSLAQSISFKNKTKTIAQPYGNNAATIFRNGTGIMCGTATQIYMPNTFCYAYNFEDPGCFKRGLNSDLYTNPKSVVNLTMHLTPETGIQGTAGTAYSSFAERIGQQQWGDIISQQVCPVVTCKIDRVMTFMFQDGVLSDIVFS